MDSFNNIRACLFATVHMHKINSSANAACICLSFTAILNSILYRCKCLSFVSKWHDSKKKYTQSCPSSVYLFIIIIIIVSFR